MAPSRDAFIARMIAGVNENAEELYAAFLAQRANPFPLSDAPLATPAFVPIPSGMAPGEAAADAAKLAADTSREQLALAFIRKAIELMPLLIA